MPLQIRRGTQAEANVLASPPQDGELVYVTDSQQLYIGDGTTLLRDLMPVTGYTDEEARNAAGAALSGGTHSGISFVNDDAGNKINATLNTTQSFQNLTVTTNTTLGATTINGTLSVTGKLIADFNGSIHADDSTLLVDGVDSKINLDGTVKGNIIPDVTEAYDIGSSSLKFKDLYLSGSSLWLGAAQITSTSTAINLPAGSTINGDIIQSEVSDDDAFVRDIQGSVFADDSTQLVNAIDATVYLHNGTVTINDNIISLTGTNELKLGEVTDVASPSMVVTNTDGSPSFISVVNGDASLGGISSSYLMRGIFGADMSSPSAANAGDYVGQMTSRGYDPTTSSYITTGAIAFRVDNQESVASDTYKGKIEFINNNGTGSSPVLNYMTFDAQGRLAVNQQDAAATLDVNGFAKLAILTAAPASPANGMIAIADGTSWDPLGGGASGKQQMVVYLGSAWTQIAVGP